MSSSVVVSPTFFMGEVEGTSIMPTPSCDAWRVFLGELGVAHAVHTAKTLSIVSQVGILLEDVAEFSCDDASVVDALVQALVMGERFLSACLGEPWEAHVCDTGAVLCVGTGCGDDVCSSGRRHGLLAPCSGGFSGSRRRHLDELPGDMQDGGTIFVMASSFGAKYPPLHIANVTLIHSMNGDASPIARVVPSTDALSASAGLVHCRAYDEGGQPKTPEDIVSTGGIGALSRSLGYVDVRLPPTSLLPSSSYTVFCITTSTEGTVLPLSNSIAAGVSLSTACCKLVTLAWSPQRTRRVGSIQRILPSSAGAPVLSLALTTLPVSQLGLVVYAVPSTGTTTRHILPSVLMFSAASTAPYVVDVFLPPMDTRNNTSVFTIGLDMSVAAHQEYAIAFPELRTFEVLQTSGSWPLVLAPLTPPDTVSAIFTSDGSHVIVAFGINTDGGKVRDQGPFPCSSLLVGVAESCSAAWVSGGHASLVLYDDSLLVGSTISLPSDTLKAACDLPRDQYSACAEWLSNVESIVAVIELPVNLETPVVDIAMPDVLGACTNLVVGTSGSRGSGGRPWMSLATTLSTTDMDPSRLAALDQAWGGNHNDALQPVTAFIMPASVLSHGHVYTVTAVRCSFLGACGVATRSVSVLGEIYGVLPNAIIFGERTRALYCHEPLVLKADAYVDRCAGGQSRAGITVSWTVTNKATRSLIVDAMDMSLSKDVTRLWLPGHTLSASNAYEITLHASSDADDGSARNGVTFRSSTTVIVRVLSQDVHAVIEVEGDARARSGPMVGRRVSTTAHVRPGETSTLYADRSYDPDTGLYATAAEMRFLWSCSQILPVVLPGDCTGFATPPMNMSVFPVTFVREHTVSNVTLRVERGGAGDGQRPSFTSVLVYTLAFTEPVVRGLYAERTRKVDPETEFTVSGSVGYETATTIRWSVSPEVPHLVSKARTPLSISAPAPVGGLYRASDVFVKLSAGTLLPGIDYTFKLTCSYSSGLSTTSAILVSTNDVPFAGRFHVRPDTGIEFDAFTFEASMWTDGDLPLTYVFRTGDGFPLQVRSERRSGTHKLMAGSAVHGFKVRASCTVFDTYNAQSTATQDVFVAPPDSDGGGDVEYTSRVADFTASELGHIVSNTSISAPLFTAQLISTIGTAASALNVVNCSLLFNDGVTCLARNRFGCSTTAHSCGKCLSGFIGEQGSANSRCVLLVEVTNTTLMPYRECPSSCSGRGICEHRYAGDTRTWDTGSAHCSVLNTSCVVVCVCEAGFAGPGCEYVSEDLLARSALKEDLLEALLFHIYTAVDLHCRQDLEDSIQGMLDLCSRPSELSHASKVMLEPLLLMVSDAALRLSLSDDPVAPTLILQLYGIFDIVLDVTEDPTGVLRALRILMESVTLSMVDSEMAISAISDVLLMKSKVMGGGESVALNDSAAVISMAHSTFDSAMRGAVPAVNLTSVLSVVESTIAASLVIIQGGLLTASHPYNTSSRLSENDLASVVMSDGLQLDLSESDYAQVLTNTCAFPGMQPSAPLVAVVILPLLSRFDDVDIGPPLTGIVSHHMCILGERSMRNVTCGDELHTLECNGTVSGDLSLSCQAVVTKEPTCGTDLFPPGDSGLARNCTTLEVTPNALVCECDMCSFIGAGTSDGSDSSSSSTEDEIGGVDEDRQSSQTTKLERYRSVGTIEVVAMAEFVLTEFADVVSNFDDIGDADTYKGTTIVWGAMLALISFATAVFGVAEYTTHNADLKKKRRTVGRSESFVEGLRRKSVGGILLEGNMDANDDSAADFHAYIESLFPVVFRDTSTLSRFVDELVSSHALFVVFCAPEFYDRLLSLYELVSQCLQAFFIIALVTNLETGSANADCDMFRDEEACVTVASVYNSDAACLWGEVSGRCSENPAAAQLGVLSLVSVICITLMLGIPLSFMHSLIFDDILHAPTTTFAEGSDNTASASIAPAATVAEGSSSSSSNSSLSDVETGGGGRPGDTPSDVLARSKRNRSEYARSRTVLLKASSVVVGAYTAVSRLSRNTTIRPSLFLKQGSVSLLVIKVPHSVAMHRQRIFTSHVYGTSLRASMLSTSGVMSSAVIDEGVASDHTAIARRQRLRGLSGERAFVKLHNMMLAHVADRRSKGQQYTALNGDPMWLVGQQRANAEKVVKVNNAFCNLWGITVVDRLSGELCNKTAMATKVEAVEVKWSDKTKVLTALNETIVAANIATDNISRFDSTSAGAEVFRLLVVDLLGRNTPRGKIYDMKSRSHMQQTSVVSPLVKAGTFVLSLVLNAFYFVMCVLYGAANDVAWQMAWLLYSLCFIIFMLVFEDTLELVMIGFVIPIQCLQQIRALKVELKARLDSATVFQALLDHFNAAASCVMTGDGLTHALPDRQGIRDNATVGIDQHDSFSATDYLFVSSYVSEQFSMLPESLFIRFFLSPHPRSTLITHTYVFTAENADMLVTAGPGEEGMFRVWMWKVCTWLARLVSRVGAISISSVLLWVGCQPLVFQKLIVHAPLPIISSILTGFVLIAANQSVEVTILLFSSIAVLIFAMAFAVICAVRNAIHTSVAADELDRERQVHGMKRIEVTPAGRHTRILERRGSILEPAYESCSSPSEDEPGVGDVRCDAAGSGAVTCAGPDTGAGTGASTAAHGGAGAMVSIDSDGCSDVGAIDMLSGSHTGVTAAVQAELMKREAALESELLEMEQTLDRDVKIARLADRLARRNAGNVDADGGDIQASVLEATANRARHLQVARVMRTDFQQRSSMEVAQARKRSVIQKRLKNRLVMRDVAASSTGSSSDVNDDSDWSVGASSTGSSSVSFVFSDDAALESEYESEAECEFDAASEVEERTADVSGANGKGTAVPPPDADTKSRKTSRKKSKTAKVSVRKSERKTKTKGIRKSTKLAKAGVSGKISKGSTLRKVASSIAQRRISVAGDIFNEAATFIPAIVSATGGPGNHNDTGGADGAPMHGYGFLHPIHVLENTTTLVVARRVSTPTTSCLSDRFECGVGDRTTMQKSRTKAVPGLLSERVLSPVAYADSFKNEGAAFVSSSSTIVTTTIKKKSVRSLKLTSARKSGGSNISGIRTCTSREVLSPDGLVRQPDVMSLVPDVAAPVYSRQAGISTTFRPVHGPSVIRRHSSITDHLAPRAVSTSEVAVPVGKRTPSNVRPQHIVSTWISSCDSGTSSSDSD